MRNRGRRNIIPYVPFEALKVRDLRLEPVPHHYYYEDIRKDLKKPQRPSGVKRATLFILFVYFIILLLNDLTMELQFHLKQH